MTNDLHKCSNSPSFSWWEVKMGHDWAAPAKKRKLCTEIVFGLGRRWGQRLFCIWLWLSLMVYVAGCATPLMRFHQSFFLHIFIALAIIIIENCSDRILWNRCFAANISVAGISSTNWWLEIGTESMHGLYQDKLNTSESSTKEMGKQTVEALDSNIDAYSASIVEYLCTFCSLFSEITERRASPCIWFTDFR